MLLPSMLLLISAEWLQRNKQHGLDLKNVNIPAWVRWLIYYALILLILYCSRGPQKFIYFKF